MDTLVIMSLNEVFGDIMVLASPPPRPPSYYVMISYSISILMLCSWVGAVV